MLLHYIWPFGARPASHATHAIVPLYAFLDVEVGVCLAAVTGATAGAEDVEKGHGSGQGEEEPAHTSISNPSLDFTPPMSESGAYHSNAAKTAAAFAAEHTCPKHTRSLKKTASAMKPANQKSIVSISTPRIANL